MLFTLHWLTLIFYWTAPIVAALIAVARSNRRDGQSVITYLTALVAGAMLGTSLTVLNARGVHGRASIWQFFLAIYFATGLMLALKSFNWLLRWVMQAEKRETTRGWRVTGSAIRGVTLVVLGIPYVVSAIMVYHPKAEPLSEPMSQLRLPYDTVRFESTDGVSLSGWWIPAASTGRRGFGSRDAPPSNRTVIICPGWGENKATQLVLARRLVPAGYNALIFDFRGYGQSGGQIVTLGDKERRDVLGAVRWLKQQHPQEAEHVLGLGASTGGAALIAAAADKSPEGQAIEALAVYGTYDNLFLLARAVASRSFTAPMDWLTTWVGMGLACVQTGTNLFAFSPAELVQQVWPRPILIIHATYDLQIPFDRGHRLFQSASFPKQPLWLPQEFGDEAIRDDDVANTVREFFENARPMPVI